MVPYGNGDAPEIAGELLDVGAPETEALALRVTLGDATDTVLYAFDGAREMAAGDVRANARLALVRSRPGQEPPPAC